MIYKRQLLYCKLLCIVVFVQQCTGKNDDKCNMDGVSGTCVPLDKCDQYYSLLRNSATTLQGLDVTQKRQCGFEGQTAKVCCPEEKVNATVLPKAGEEDNDFVEELPKPGLCGHGPDLVPPLISPSKVYPSTLLNAALVMDRRTAKWMALLGYKDEAVFWQCGGTIITSRHVLTAAHCIKTSLYLVRVGVLDLAEEQSVNGPIDFLVKRAIPHENYTRYHNDIAIVVLNGTIDFSNTDYLAPICLPERNVKYEKVDQHKTYVTGWGETGKREERPTRLMYAYMDVLAREQCVRAYNRSYLQIDERVLCAGDERGKHDACNGDSGGPLIHNYYIRSPPVRVQGVLSIFNIQIGIVSYGFKCSASKFMGLYTNVSYFMPWIEEKILGRSLAP